MPTVKQNSSPHRMASHPSQQANDLVNKEAYARLLTVFSVWVTVPTSDIGG
jgi:hypothetical protein